MDYYSSKSRSLNHSPKDFHVRQSYRELQAEVGKKIQAHDEARRYFDPSLLEDEDIQDIALRAAELRKADADKRHGPMTDYF